MLIAGFPSAATELAGRYRDGLTADGASVIDAGQVGSEMLYFLVGWRRDWTAG